MEQQQAAPKREWPKFLWGPDGQRARFDSPADVPRDYTVEKQEPKHQAEAPAPVAAPAGVSPELIAAITAQVREQLKAEQREKMARARAAKGKG